MCCVSSQPEDGEVDTTEAVREPSQKLAERQRGNRGENMESVS